MTNRQSNIIFYSIISLIIYAIIINYIYPDFFENLSKSNEELSIQEAMENGEHKRALTLYELKEKNVNSDTKNSPKIASMYAQMAQLHALLNNKQQEKAYLLKSIAIIEKLKKPDTLLMINIYEKLGGYAENNKQYDEAQRYYEKSLSKKLEGSNKEEDKGLFVGMQNTRQKYLRLNNEQTIITLKKLGEIHTIKREYVIAKEYYQRALTASQLTFGENDQKTLEVMKLMNQIVL